MLCFVALALPSINGPGNSASGWQGQQCAGTYTKGPTQAGTWPTFLFKPPYSGSAARAKFNLGDSAIKNSAEEKISTLGAKGMRTYRRS